MLYIIGLQKFLRLSIIMLASFSEKVSQLLGSFGNGVLVTHGIRICIKRKKIIHGKFFDFCAEKCVYN